VGARRFSYAKNYLKAHVVNPKWFSGRIDIENVDMITGLVGELEVDPRELRLLDYGSGKGYQYLRDRVHDRWGGVVPHCYDIGVMQLQEKPTGKFHGVICTDVMEHIDRPDVDQVLEDVFGFLYTDRPVFAYFNIFCNLASKSFPDGRNVHLTVRPPEWWDNRLRRFERPGLTIRADYEYVRDHDLQP
jgi:hypothetical protein